MKYLFSDRFGGFSKGDYSSLNLALHVNDNPLDVKRNREILAKKMGVESLVFMEQVHKDTIKIVDKNESATFSRCDGLITGVKGVALCVMVADCMPILFYDKKAEVVAVAHAGREGVRLKIANRVVQKMRDDFGAKDIEVFIGPSIKSCCYEVKSDVLDGFEGYYQKREGRFYLDIRQKCKDDLEKIGVAVIKQEDICTCCDKRYYSYRREGKTGRFVGAIKL